MFDYFNCGRVHFLGVGGVSTSLLARFLHTCGVPVSGTDRESGDTLLSLQEAGLDVWTGFLPEKTGRPGAVVYSSAISKSDPEYLYLASCGIPLFERYDLLGAVSKVFSCTVGIAGTHGKTTTTAMISKVLSDAGKKLFSNVGGRCRDQADFLFTGKDYFVCEACEYKKSLLSLRPDIAVVLNAEVDHPDTYKDLSEIYDTFDLYLENAGKNSIRLVCGDSPYYFARQTQNHPMTFGRGENNVFRIIDEREREGRYGCDVLFYGEPVCSFDLSVIGRHNLLNGAACVAVCALLKIDKEVVARSLGSFSGVNRRFEYKGTTRGAKIFSDYAHHPTEIAAALTAARNVLGKKGRLIAVFQPHTFSRTEALLPQFVDSLLFADALILVKEYAAREKEENGMSAERLFYYLKNRDKTYCKTLLDAAAVTIKKIAPGDLILVLGAGDVDLVCDLITGGKE